MVHLSKTVEVKAEKSEQIVLLGPKSIAMKLSRSIKRRSYTASPRDQKFVHETGSEGLDERRGAAARSVVVRHS